MRVGEPIYKKTFTKPLPKGAKAFSRKKIKYARFADSAGETQVERTTKNGKKLLCETQCWYIRFDDHEGIRRIVKAYTDWGASDYLYRRIIELLNYKRKEQPIPPKLQEYLEQNEDARKQLIKFGLLNCMAGAEKTLAELVDDFKDSLIKKERLQRYVEESARTLKTTFEDCSFRTWSDIKGDVLNNYLDDRRDGGRGISKRRFNNILRRVQQFCRWHVKKQKYNGNMDIKNPVEYLDAKDNVETDSRHPRRAIEIDEFRRFLYTALTGEKKRNLTGYERNFVYRFAAETAMRKVDINRLRVKDCDFKNRKIFIQAARIKNKEDAYIYLKPETTLELQQYCKNKLPDAKVFHLPAHPEQMLRFDLANTEVKDASGKVITPAIPYKDEFGRYFDFHSLRHQATSLYAMNPNTSESVRQKLSRHKTPEMVRHYSHVSESEQRQAVEALPDLTTPGSQSQVQIKTGTDAASLSNACFIDGTKRDNTIQGDKSGKLRPVLSNENSDIRPMGKVENCSNQNSETDTNSENPHYSAKNSGDQDPLVLNRFYDKDFDPKLQEVIKKWPSLSEELKAAILKMIE